MSDLLATKLHRLPLPAARVERPRLITRLNEGLQSGRRLTLVSAPAGFGKTTCIGEWLDALGMPAAWLSLDEGDSDPARFLAYLIAALQTVAANVGGSVSAALQSPQPPAIESILTILLNEIGTIPDKFILVLDDYHLTDAGPIDTVLLFLIRHLPPRMHLVVASREDPNLPLARLRARGQLTELRAADLRFTPGEAADFLNRTMGLRLSAEDIAALENRTEGWIAGLQLAGLSMQEHPDTAGFIRSFTGSHRFVLDYLVEEVLRRQPPGIQEFLVRTSILDRLCGPLCDAVMLDASASGQAILEHLERANLFIIPLDHERRWYRYHHLFADFLRQRLHPGATLSPQAADDRTAELHIRASQWLEDHGLGIEAFQHAAAANDIERAERLIEGHGIPLHLRGAVMAILNWLGSLPQAVLDARPSLWWRYGSLMLASGQTTGAEEKLDAAETALRGIEMDDKTRNLLGRIAVARAVLALFRYQPETMLAQSRCALEYLPPDNLNSRATATWTMGVACLYQADRPAARTSLNAAIALSQAIGDIFTAMLATSSLGEVEELENQLHPAAEAYQRVLKLAGGQPLQITNVAHLGLARILYEWNQLEAAEQHGLQSLELARQYDTVIDWFIPSEIFLARLKLARGDVNGAAALLAQADQSARQRNFAQRMPEIAAAQALTLLRQGNLPAAERLAQAHDLPASRARVCLAQGKPSAALAVLEPLCQQMQARGLQAERLQAMTLQAIALEAQGQRGKAAQVLGEVLALAEPGGFIRLFVDEGPPMKRLLQEAAARGIAPDYTRRLLEAFAPARAEQAVQPADVDALSGRELEVLRLIAEGLSNREISERLCLALSTVKGHSRIIFDKLRVQRRTEAVARARELGLL